MEERQERPHQQVLPLSSVCFGSVSFVDFGFVSAIVGFPFVFGLSAVLRPSVFLAPSFRFLGSAGVLWVFFCRSF